MKISILEAKKRLSELMQSVLAGEDIVITNRGNPVVRIVPFTESENKKLDHPEKNLGAWLGENPLPDQVARSHEEIELSMREQRDSWD